MDRYIRGHRLTDKESEFYMMCESDRAFQKAVDALNEIGYTSFILSKEDIKQMFEEGRSIKIDSICN